MANFAERYGQYRLGRAQYYGQQSLRLRDITEQTLDPKLARNPLDRNLVTVNDPSVPGGRVARPGGPTNLSKLGIHGYIPREGEFPIIKSGPLAGDGVLGRTKPGQLLNNVPTQRLLSWTAADKLNRLPADVPPNPTVVNSPALRANPDLPVNTGIKRIGGLNLLETGRRGLTKVSGPVSLGLGVAEVADQVANGVPVARAVGRTGSGLVVSGAAGALGAAGVAALVPGPGWAVAGGIVVGTAASMVWDHYHLGDKVGDAANSAWNWAKQTFTSPTPAVEPSRRPVVAPR